jgi:SAM-dependent methyltransferase
MKQKLLQHLAKAREVVSRGLRSTAVGTCAIYLAANQLAKLRLLRGDIGSDSGSTLAKFDSAASLAYVRSVYQDYLNEAGISKFSGRIAEVGPGDNCGVALLMLADGAVSIDLVDRFYSRRDLPHLAQIYSSLIAETKGLSAFAGLDREEQFPGIRRHYGEEASAEQFFLQHRRYDFIVSRAVLEHVRDPVLSLQRMHDALNPGGMMIHVVDLRDHGMFTSAGFHELKFLEIPAWLYPQMTTAIGAPNRVPLSHYRRALPGAIIKVARLVGQSRFDRPMLYDDIPARLRKISLDGVRRQKPRMSAEFRRELDEDLSVASFYLISQKAAA